MNIAVIDTETNWNNELMSVGCVIADAKELTPINGRYFIIDPEYLHGGMYSSVLFVENMPYHILSRQEMLTALTRFMQSYGVKYIFAYNAKFDRALLSELSSWHWFDIMRLAAYRQYNKKIPADADCCNTGRLRRDFGVEPILRMLTGNEYYQEMHNALADAVDELSIMRYLGHSIGTYLCAHI